MRLRDGWISQRGYLIADVNLSVRTARKKSERKEVEIHDKEKENLGVSV